MLRCGYIQGRCTSVFDRVFRVAGNGIDLILFKAHASGRWPAGLERLLEGITPWLRLVTVAPAASAPLLASSDASLPATALVAWLSVAWGRGE